MRLCQPSQGNGADLRRAGGEAEARCADRDRRVGRGV